MLCLVTLASAGAWQQASSARDCGGGSSVADLVELLKSEVADQRIRDYYVSGCGIDFVAGASELETLRAAGASAALLELVASKPVQEKVEAGFWAAAKATPDTNTKALEEYLRRYPQGAFIEPASALLLARNSARLRETVKSRMAARRWAEASAAATELAALNPADPDARNWVTALKKRVASEARLTGLAQELTNLGLVFVPIPAGGFMMGSNNGRPNKRPAHSVDISRAFEMSRTEVTQAQWQWLMGNNPSQFRNPKRPVEQVTWNDTQDFIRKLNERDDGYTYRLPTEAEWEYAARAGTEDDYAGNLDAMAWYKNNAAGATHEVGSKEPNGFGLHDMHGNVWEWCADYYAEGYYSSSPIVDPQGPGTGTTRVVRGGSWYYAADQQRSSFRLGMAPLFRNANFGFRLVREPIDSETKSQK